MDIKDKSVTSNAKGQNAKRDFSTLCPAIQCNKCQGYGYDVVIYPSLTKVVKVKKPHVTNPETLPPLLPTPTVVVYSCCQPLSPLLPTQSPLKIVIDKLSITESEFDCEEFIYQVEEPEDHVSDKEI